MTKALLQAISGLFLATNLLKTPQVLAQDLPVKGASFFDSMQNTVGIIYDGTPLPLAPHPFEALLTKLNQHSSFFTSVIPFGRSLQKMAAYPQSLKYPRVLVATSELSKDLNTHFRGRLFIAYVEAAKKLEVISFNPLMGRYEFQIVDNFYPGGKAQARYMPRSLCLRCHQGGTPIFAGGEWQETTAFNAELQKLSEAAIGKKEYFGIPLGRDAGSSKYDAQPLPELFEDMVRFGALLIGHQKAWQDICAKARHPISCKRNLVKWMLVTNLYDKVSLEPDLDLLRGFVSVLGDGTVPLASEKLPDHNPVVQGQLSYHMPPEADPSLPREPLQIAMAAKGDAQGLQFFKFYTFVKNMGQSFFTEQDFKRLRALLGKPEPRSTDRICLPDPGALMQDFKAKSVEHCISRANWQSFMKAIDSISWARDEVLSREKILPDLDKKLGTQFAENICCQTKLAASARQAAEPKKRLDPVVMKDQRLQSFITFCSECHLYQDLPPPFLAGENEARVLQNIKDRAELIQFRLQSKQMPPQFARRQPNEVERQDLLQDLKNISTGK